MPRRSSPDSDNLKVGTRIRELRHERGMSLGALSDASGLSKCHLSSIESGYHAINVKTINDIAAAFNTAPMFLLACGDDERQRAAELLRFLPLREVRRVRRQLQGMLRG